MKIYVKWMWMWFYVLPFAWNVKSVSDTFPFFIVILREDLVIFIVILREIAGIMWTGIHDIELKRNMIL